MQRQQGTGLVLGKFMPPHRGHQALIEFAAAYCERLIIVVGSMPGEPIDGHLRFQWLQQLAPNAEVLHLHQTMPQHPHEHPQFWQLWREALRDLAQTPFDWVFASEDYGFRLAEELAATYVPFDPTRSMTPICATDIRCNPSEHWDFLTDVCKPFFLKTVCVFGPESTGKSTLCADLAAHFDTAWVPEYARFYLEARDGVCGARDMPAIARGQAALTASKRAEARRVLVCDTDLWATELWSHALFGACAPAIPAWAAEQSADLYLLTDVDVPWVADNVRYLPEQRREFFDACQALLEREGLPYVVIRGGWETRRQTAVAAVAALLDTPTVAKRSL